MQPTPDAGTPEQINKLLSRSGEEAIDKVLLGDASDVSRRDRGPRRPRVDNPRRLGSASHVEIPAKDARKRRNKAQRQARKANR